MSLSKDEPVLRLQHISKQFPGVFAVNDVSLDVYPGEVHVVAGENGAGKSTLMKLLSQVEKPSSGTILLNHEPIRFHGPQHAQSLGIAMIYQEFALAPHLTIAQNMFLGQEPLRLGLIDRSTEIQRSRTLLKQVGLNIDPRRLVSGLSVAEQQLVEIAKALSLDAKVVIMDEPTATLTEQEIHELFNVIHNMTERGIAILYISHRLDEIFRIAHRVTVMRDGQVVATLPRAEIDEKKLIRLMVGREIANLYPKPSTTIGEVVLRVTGITRAHVLRNCSFELHAGEILGFAGLVGAGRTELARAIFGADRIDAGTIEVEGKKVRIKSPEAAIQAGIGYLTEDRKRDGLAMNLGIDQNITMAHLPVVAGILNLGQERRTALQARDQLRIRTPSIRRKVEVLSGGTQQKVIVARWLETQAKVLFFDEPTRGIDVGAKAEIFDLIGKLAQQGRAIILISSYLPELLNMCDRILVIREGQIAGAVEREQFSEERIIALATGAREIEAQ
ncbi:sugar ABC transporter ATP-binding protein [Dictyobacter arantiisoli]|uniref:Ribose import ATP-binding protein RbsA n=1 Tax=Dictyobacter arantiisoli TaxID=2014874 RepID=A0A5A5TE17_9CHLR|nr:sugar ABC transporter ATP-binding protein [Dictyobacter arantiisoli]GCF09662.1 ribose import ATP-binding protein RbsA [Dictyobacter arantiisoli]